MTTIDCIILPESEMDVNIRYTVKDGVVTLAGIIREDGEDITCLLPEADVEEALAIAKEDAAKG